jgi:hypothetical protein
MNNYIKLTPNMGSMQIQMCAGYKVQQYTKNICDVAHVVFFYLWSCLLSPFPALSAFVCITTQNPRLPLPLSKG